jgi:hypothetical protein
MKFDLGERHRFDYGSYTSERVSHFPISRDAVLPAQWEMLSWFNRYLENSDAAATGKTSSTSPA